MRIAFAAALAAIVAVPATAAVQTVAIGKSFADAPFTYDFGGGNTITFTFNPGDFFNPAQVSTVGTTQVASLGLPFYDPPRPTSYLANRGGSIGPETLAQFLPFAAPATIPFSIVESIVGLRFDLGQGFQYGYADIAYDTIYGFRFETTPGVGVGIAPVPEPAAWSLLIIGFAAVGVAARRRAVAV